MSFLKIWIRRQGELEEFLRFVQMSALAMNLSNLVRPRGSTFCAQGFCKAKLAPWFLLKDLREDYSFMHLKVSLSDWFGPSGRASHRSAMRNDIFSERNA
jgi:hypothetical protein